MIHVTLFAEFAKRNIILEYLRFSERHHITKILLKVALNTIKQSSVMLKYFMFSAVLG
jgi:hypothetical protein